MSPPEVVIAGLGLVCAAGVGVAQTLPRLRDGTPPAPSFRVCGARQIPVLEVGASPDRGPRLQALDLALLAAREALAGGVPDPTAVRIGVCMGTSMPCFLDDGDLYGLPGELGEVSSLLGANLLDGSLAERLATALGCTGPSLTVLNACSSSTDAVEIALAWLRAGLCDAVLAGGADELSASSLAGFHSLGLTSARACTPFDRDRDGLVLGEGAATLLLCRADSPPARGRPLLRVRGYGASNDAWHLTSPHPEGRGLERAVRAALADAGLNPEEIGFVNAHGTATRDNDRVEAQVLARVFGPGLPFHSTKGLTGHTLGAAGGLEAAFTGLGLLEGVVFRSAGFTHPDPALPVHPLRAALPLRGRYAMSTSMAFGGNNSAVILERL